MTNPLRKLLTTLSTAALVVLSSALSYTASGQCAPGRACPATAPRSAPAAPAVYRTTWNPAPARQVYQATYRPGAAPTYATPSAEPRLYVPQAAYAPATLPAVDPLAAINTVRARYRLGALRYDANLAGWAETNNRHCRARGQGHHQMAPGAGQIVAPTSDPGYAARMWEFSPKHAAIMLSPTATVAGISHSGGFATANVR